ncbi:related to cell wall mannoprotein [Phialocephala subalpina]|uniref:Related to cell wall mannoprotein n=1 Tax=Phialocephala subalpina TaxID=576137 RepID=A0A1L7XY96_9HELO|nr:related to cell wall mannoprotein [Phialocephala subalpina]
MSQQQWPAPTRSPGGGGSVRRAREMAEQGIAPQVPSQIPRPPQRAFDNPRAAPSAPTNRPRPQLPPALVTTKNGQGPIGVAISRPTQVPQWPLAATIEGGPDPQYQPPPGRGVPPQRPPRPSHVPSMLDASRLQDPTPSFQYQPPQRGYEEDDIISPLVTSPMTQSSRQSTLSSVGSIPDFPVPMPPPGPPRRSANLGPPPSSRRGASSYYSQASFVSPIPEESPRTVPSHQSYASSAAMPTSWGSDSPRYDEDDYEDEEVYDRDSRDYRDEGRGFGSPIEEGRESMKSRESNGDDSDDRGLIRSASFGRRAKPSMITTRGSERADPARPQPIPQQSQQQMSKLEKMGVIAGVGGLAQGFTASKASEAGQRETVWPIIGDVSSPLATGTGLIDKSSTSSEETVPTIARAVTTNESAPAYAANRSDPATEKEMLGAYNAASSLSPPPAPVRTPSPGFSRLSAIRRPPRLDMDAVRDAEARGSLTSLPDLIRRATRLAAMMDRGKRPGSRLALNDWPTEDEMARDKELGLTEDEKHKSGLSGMLAAFPPPGIATPTRGGTPTRPVSSWPSAGQYGDSTDSSKTPKKKRRCCGLPCWGFILVLIILLIIIAAAVVVPLELLVFHKPSNKSSSTTVSALQQCEASSTTACKNGGTSVIDNNSCACICTNGFTGSTCTTANATGCTTTTLSNLANVTLGDSIERLIADAQTNFSIPLSESTIVARFNNANLTCASENALVTFDGESTREGNANDVVSSGTGTKKRWDTTSSASWSVATSAGIIYDSSTHSSSSASKTSSASTSTSSASSAATNPLGLFNITEEVLDFARVAVLYILQQEQLDSAVTAQSGLQKFFSLQSFTNMAAANVSLGNGNLVDLLAFTVNVGNGTVGSKNVSAVSSKVRRREPQLPRRSTELWRAI